MRYKKIFHVCVCVWCVSSYIVLYLFSQFILLYVRHFRELNFKLFFSDGGEVFPGQFKWNFSPFRLIKFKIFYNHGGQFKWNFSHFR